MALFGKKKGDDESNGEGDQPASAGGPPQSHPEKAKRFFERARTVQQAGSFEYAMINWLGGIRQDPNSMDGLEGFWSAATAFAGENSKLSKETSKTFSTKGDLEKYLSALLAWGAKPTDGSAAVRAAELGAKLQLPEPTYWIGERALMLVASDPKKAKKETFLKLMESLAAIGAYERAAQAGDMAVRADPSDTELATRVRNFTAQATISGGGFDQTGEEGGFRANLKDADKQRKLQQQQGVVKSENARDQAVKDAEADFEARPDDLPTIKKLVDALVERGSDADEKRALVILTKAFEDTKQFQFRQRAGQIKLKRFKRQLAMLKSRAESNPQDAEAVRAYEQGRQKVLKTEVEEIKLQVDAYPTDRGLKFQLGKLHYEMGQYDEAIELLQEAQRDSKNRSNALRYLGECWIAKGWIDDAVHTYRDALDKHENPDDDLGMELRYGLLTALETKATNDRDIEVAKEASEIASAIARQQFGFRDIKERRESLQKLVAELRSA